VSEFIADRVRELSCPEEKIRVLPVGVPIPPLPERPPGAGIRFLAVGRLVPVKGPLLTLEAFRLVRRELPTASLCLIGDGPLMDDARAFVNESGLGRAVSLLGQVPHARVYQEMARADVFVQHSIRTADGQQEGCSLTLVEAAAHGLPTVGTRSGGTPEAVLDGVTGFLVPERDVAAMAEKMLYLATDAGLRAEMGAAGRRRAIEHFDLDKQNAKIESLYDEITGQA
jgi:glycosyltransferase involved in cell wall biosynthesis